MIFKQHPFGPCVTVSVFLSAWMNVACIRMEIQLIPQDPFIRGSVTLSVTGINREIQSYQWFKGPDTNKTNQILTYVPAEEPPLTSGPLFHNRIKHFGNGSLQISSLNIRDEGNYTVKIQTNTENETSVYLKIYKTVGKPKVTTSTSLPQENYAVTLNCNATNTENIVWNRVPYGASLSLDNRTITFSRINRGDSGDYWCEAENLVSKEISDPYKLTVSYGPENIKVKAWPLLNSAISIECTAESVPPPTYQWRLNGEDINVQQNPFQVDHSKEENEGTYTCAVNNPVTQHTVTDSIYVNASIEFTDNDGENYTNAKPIGFIAGTIIAIVLLLLLVALLTYLLHRLSKKQSMTNVVPAIPLYENVNAPQSHTSETALPGIPVETTQESHYEQLAPNDRNTYNTLASARNN